MRCIEIESSWWHNFRHRAVSTVSLHFHRQKMCDITTFSLWMNVPYSSLLCAQRTLKTKYSAFSRRIIMSIKWEYCLLCVFVFCAVTGRYQVTISNWPFCFVFLCVRIVRLVEFVSCVYVDRRFCWAWHIWLWECGTFKFHIHLMC